MRLPASLRPLAGRLFHRSAIEDDLEQELRSHIQHRADDLERSGLTRAEAERRARLEFGGHTRFKEECHDELGGVWIETLWQDLRFNLRVLRKSPGFTIAAVLTLAFGIGANAVVFGVLNALILRPLNVPHAQDLYAVETGHDQSSWQSYPDYVDLRDRNRSFEALAAYTVSQAALDTGSNPSLVWGYEASGNYFDALGIQPYLGRFFHGSDEYGPNSAPFIVLTYAYWHSHFQDDRGVVGRVVRLNKHPFTIIGVAPADFHGTLLFFSPDFFVPMVNEEQVDGANFLSARGNHWIFMSLGHLKPGVTPQHAIGDLNSIGAYMERTYPKEDGHMTFSLARPGLAGDFLGRPARAFVTGLMLLAALILLAACANLGSLFAARAADRSRELALRLALGARRGRILRQMLLESVLISLAGGGLGLWGSVLLLGRLSVWQPFPRFPITVPVQPDARVYAVALILALFSGILFGLVPVRQVLRVDPYQVVKSGSTGAIGPRITVRDLLLVVQIAICAVLVTSSMVAVRGLIRSLHGDFGFQPDNVMLVTAELTMSGYSGDRVPAMQKRILDAVQAIPGVASVGLIDDPPLNMGGSMTFIYSDQTTDFRLSNVVAEPYIFLVSPDYFRAAGTSLLTGRSFTWHDDRNAARVAVVNRVFAAKVLGSATNAVGKYFKRRDGTRIEVVGLVEDGKYLNLAEDPQPAMFLPILQSPSSGTSLVVRSNRYPEQLAGAVKATLHGLDEGLPVFLQTWNKALDGVLFAPRVATVALSVLAVLGALLAVTGIFGMAAYAVSKRLRELGIRIALGAQRNEVLQAALGRAFKLLAVGSCAGLMLGLLATRVLSAIVYHATPRDPLVLAGVVLAMLLLGLFATWIPAQRALSADPLALLREE